ncbi:hypothetical protein [Enterococcus faecium]|uniref:hypothetical protein n=1 Tax=Enterococcus faecium TaxID=1352 RepID=UPI000BF1D639|nr:hypothetical protein [Enterococcus faecium]PEH49465.1 hypothetical protein CRM75_01470 [Enterococcus faecium]
MYATIQPNKKMIFDDKTRSLVESKKCNQFQIAVKRLVDQYSILTYSRIEKIVGHTLTNRERGSYHSALKKIPNIRVDYYRNVTGGLTTRFIYTEF